MDLIATKSVKYAGGRREPGDAFTASTRDGRILIAIGKARLAEATAEEKPAEKVRKAKYKRRDMTAGPSDD